VLVSVCLSIRLFVSETVFICLYKPQPSVKAEGMFPSGCDFLIIDAAATCLMMCTHVTLLLLLLLLCVDCLLLCPPQLGYYGYKEQQALKQALLLRQQELEQSECQIMLPVNLMFGRVLQRHCQMGQNAAGG
jgi:hypothetical protein